MPTDYAAIRRKRNLAPGIAQAAYKTALASLPLAALRADVGLTQTSMAERLGISQAAVSKLEGRGDFFVSTLQRYVDAVGGNLEMTISAAHACYRLVSEHSDGDALFRLELCTAKDKWEALAQTPPPPSEKVAGLWTKRLRGAEDIDVLSALVDCANENHVLEAA